MTHRRVEVVVYYGADAHMRKATENDILPENVPKTARLLMDDIYLRLDDQVASAAFREHRRQLREKRLNERTRGGSDGTRV